MQDRIKELAREAGFDVDDGEITAPWTTITGDPMDITDHVTKLVQAAARECAEICALHQEGGVGGWKHNTPLDCENAIRARFGLASPPGDDIKQD